jgi:hypothetical protein
MKNNKTQYDEAAAIQAAQERSAEPHPRDILKREYNESVTRPRNEAFEIWREVIHGMMLTDLELRRKLFKEGKAQPEPSQPRRDGADME